LMQDSLTRRPATVIFCSALAPDTAIAMQDPRHIFETDHGVTRDALLLPVMSSPVPSREQLRRRWQRNLLLLTVRGFVSHDIHYLNTAIFSRVRILMVLKVRLAVAHGHEPVSGNFVVLDQEVLDPCGASLG
jgi:hypothetical protein